LNVHFTVGTSYEKNAAAGLSDFSALGSRMAAFFSASGVALSQEVQAVKWMSNQPAL
jgi:hypothetical protein